MLPADSFLSEVAASDRSLRGTDRNSTCLQRGEGLHRVDLGGYDRLFKTVNSLWFIVAGNENPSVLEMKYNNVDKVISAEALLSEEGDATWHL